MRSRAPLLFAITLVFGAFAVAGCGSSSSSSSTPAGGSTGSGSSTGFGSTGATAADQRYIEKADQICKSFNANLGNASIPETPPLYERFIADISALTPPADKRAEATKWEAALKRKLAIVKKLSATLDAAKVAALNAEIQTIDTSSPTKALGLSEC